MRQVISTPDAPRSPLYSQGVRCGDDIFISGLVGIDTATGTVSGPTIQEQTRQALANCEAVLKAAGATLADVLEVGVLLADPDDFAGMNEEWATWFPTDPPARYAAKLGAVIPGILVSIRMTARIVHATEAGSRGERSVTRVSGRSDSPQTTDELMALPHEE